MAWVQEGDPLPFESGDGFLRFLSGQYEVHDLNADAKTEIINFKQNELPFTTFLSKFATLADRAGWSAQQKIDGMILKSTNAMRAMHKVSHDDPPKGD